jgi:alpha-glucoside transport system substrate-binding protein
MKEAIEPMRKPIVLMLVLSVLMLLAACGRGGGQATPTSPPPAATSVPSTATPVPPTETPVPETAAVPDFAQLGFPTVLASQDITPGEATTIDAPPYTIQVPADAFDTPVKLDVLISDPANFEAQVPAGETPVLAFALRATNAETDELIAKFNNPVTLTAKDAQIAAGSKYYNVAPDGTFTDNPTGLSVQAGELSHPIAGAPVGWVITAPAMAQQASATPMVEPTAAAAVLRTPQEAASDAAGGQQLGGSVSVLATWGGDEQDSFMAMVKPFEDATGVKIEYTGTRDLNAVLTTRVQGGNPPDVAGLPGPGQMAEYARQGKLVDLGTVLDMPSFSQQYAQTWKDLGSVDGKLVGIFIKASVKGLIWYDPKVWQEKGYQIPQTWDDMLSLSKQIADSGTTPWCVALESGAASGWPGTDWLEDIVLRKFAPDVYKQWYEGKLKWTSPEIKQAWETWGQIVADPKMVYGGPNTMLTTNFGEVGNGLFTNPPNCYMVHQASFITSFFEQNNPDVKPVVDFDFFGFPPFDQGAPVSTEMAGDLFGMFNDTPQARALINYLVTPEAQAIWVQRGGAISPNKAVPLSDYPDQLSQKAAERLTSTEIAVFDASDLMPEAMNNAFWQAILNYVQNPQNLDSILQNLDSAQQDAYSQ